MGFFLFLVIYCVLAFHKKPEPLKIDELNEALEFCKEDFQNRVIQMKIDDLLTELPDNNRDLTKE